MYQWDRVYHLTFICCKELHVEAAPVGEVEAQLLVRVGRLFRLTPEAVVEEDGDTLDIRLLDVVLLQAAPDATRQNVADEA